MKISTFKDIPTLSFFTGAGFLDMGFEQSGFDIVWTNENHSQFAELYAHGYSSWRRSRDVNKAATISKTISIDSLGARSICKEAFGSNAPAVFGIVGGPPCQDFSFGGLHAGARGRRGRLTKVFFDLLLKIRPTFFVVENVPGLYRSVKHRRYIENILRGVRDQYLVDLRILNALEFGVPQHRERLFIVGLAKRSLANARKDSVDQLKENWFPWPVNEKYSDALNAFPWPRTSQFGAKLHPRKGIPPALCVGTYMLKDYELNTVANARDVFNAYSDKFRSIREGDTTGKSFKRLHRFRYSPTACYGNNEVHLHPWKPRRLSVREVMRIQGVPDSYALPEGGSLSTKFRFIGNGVPVPLAAAVAQSMRECIFKVFGQ
jgi:DNA (cytosine-5)-methyltransferase 1